VPVYRFRCEAERKIDQTGLCLPQVPSYYPLPTQALPFHPMPRLAFFAIISVSLLSYVSYKFPRNNQPNLNTLTNLKL
jgi:hypothetical protein